MAEESKDRSKTQESRITPSERKPHEPYHVRLPGFLIEEEEEIGLGDAIKHATYKMGIKHPCTGCERRAAALNRWVRFSR
jgi:hypothetical protein